MRRTLGARSAACRLALRALGARQSPSFLADFGRLRWDIGDRRRGRHRRADGGWRGITSFGQATFMGFGAYATALLTAHAGPGPGWSPWLSLPAAVVASGLASLVIGAVTLRLSGHYLALGTIGVERRVSSTCFGQPRAAGPQRRHLRHPAAADRRDGAAGQPIVFPGGVVAVAMCLLLTRNLLDSRVGPGDPRAAGRGCGGGVVRGGAGRDAHAGLRLRRDAGRAGRVAVRAHGALGQPVAVRA